MYGVVTEHSKTIVQGRQLPRICYRVHPETGVITLNRLAGLVSKIFPLLPKKPRHPSEVWHDNSRRHDFANKVNRNAE